MYYPPFKNAVLAAGYVTFVALVMFYGSKLFGGPDNVLMPIAALSLLVLSVAVMAYLFFYTPVMLYIQDRKAEAVSFFFRTVGFFAIFTAGFFLVLILLGR